MSAPASDASRSPAVVLAQGLLFPEGPLVDLDGDIWCVELRGGALCRISPAGEVYRYIVGGAPNGLALDDAGNIWYCDAERNEIRCLEPGSSRVHSVLGSIDGHDLAAPNDLAFDNAGHLVFTCPGNSRKEPTGYVGCLAQSGKALVVAQDLLFPNGIAFAADGTTLYIAETYRMRVCAARWVPNCPHELTLSPLFDTPGPIGPDGLAVDSLGRVHACIYGAGTVLVVRASGEIEDQIVIPGGHPTNCAFDPLQRFGLIVTEAAAGNVLCFPHLGPGERPFIGRMTGHLHVPG
jgi:gluconolactonase